MSATDKNPNFPGALSLVELVPGMKVRVVTPKLKEFWNAEVISVNVEKQLIRLNAKGGSIADFAYALGVVPHSDGDWSQECLSAIDNPALVGYHDYNTGKVLTYPSVPKETLTHAAHAYERLQ